MANVEGSSWDLSSFGYSEVNDPQVDLDLSRYKRYSRAGAMFLERMGHLLSPSDLGEVLLVQNALKSQLDRPLSYLTLMARKNTIYALDETNKKNAVRDSQIMWRKAQESFTLSLPQLLLEQNVPGKKTFVDLKRHAIRNAKVNIELVEIAEKEIQSQHAKYKSRFNKLTVVDPETSLESKLAHVSAKHATEIPIKLRSRIRKTVSNTLQSFSDEAGQILSTIFRNRLTISREQQTDVLSDKLDDEDFPITAYEALRTAAFKHKDDIVLRRENARRILGLKRPLGPDDLVVPSNSNEDVSLTRAKEIVQEIWSSIDPEFGEIINSAFLANRINLIGENGERRVCVRSTSQGSYMNIDWFNKPRNMLSLIHEFGHLIHNHYKTVSNDFNSRSTPSILNETVARFSELLLEENQAGTLRDRHYLSRNNVNAYFAMQDFELACYEEMSKSPEKALFADQISSLWKKKMGLWGMKSNATHGREYNWVANTHFFNLSLGTIRYIPPQILSEIIFDKYLKARTDGTKAEFARKLKTMLSMGSQHSLTEIFKVMEIDIENSQIWEQGFEKIKNRINSVHEEISLQTT